MRPALLSLVALLVLATASARAQPSPPAAAPQRMTLRHVTVELELEDATPACRSRSAWAA
jgi:hypothetical protein